MAEVADHLVPQAGLTNTKIRFAGLDYYETGQTICRFDMVDKNGDVFGTLTVSPSNQPDGTTDSLIAEAHRQVCDVLRQWLYVTDRMREGYENKKPNE